MSFGDIEIGPCPRELQAEALGVLYRRVPARVRPLVVAQAQQDSWNGVVDLEGLWIARRRGRVVGTLLSQLLAGRAGALLPPEVVLTWGRREVATALVRAVVGDLEARGAVIVQALVEPEARARVGPVLERGGLHHVTQLLYLTCPTSPPLERDPGLPEFEWRGYAADQVEAYRAVLEATYEGSLDMPELEGARRLEDVLASHQSTGRFVPERWRLGRVVGEPEAAALVLLARHPVRASWEVSYLGLTPAARGRGLGLAALAEALERARPHAEEIELAVDARNTPARRLYEAAGFVPFERREVFLARLERNRA